tara:strand:+ start:749 stop:1042 length:294 start_codon:yes stop_codon:yes gene_type:complete
MKEDGRKNNGGNKSAGRKPKIDELKFVEKLDNIINSDEAIKKLLQLIKDSNFNALKLYLEYRFGKPKETIENINHNFNQDMTKEDIKKISDSLEKKY